MQNWVIWESSHGETISPNLPALQPDLKNISTHLLHIHGLSSKERKPYLKQARVLSWHPYGDLPRPYEGEQETKKIRPPHSRTHCSIRA